MTQETAEAAWDGYRDALARLDAARLRLAQTDRDSMVGLLRRELTGPGSSDRTALRFVADNMPADHDLAVELFPELIRGTFRIDWRGVRNRRLLLQIAPSKLKALIADQIPVVLANRDSDGGDYWGLLDLLFHARFDDLMEPLIQAALESEDEDVYAVGLDWKKTLERGGYWN